MIVCGEIETGWVTKHEVVCIVCERCTEGTLELQEAVLTPPDHIVVVIMILKSFHRKGC